MRILVAEDDRITRISLVRQLTAWNHQVTEAPDGEAAWMLFQESQYDLVITDWEMPRLSGLEFIQQIRQSNRKEYVYVIMLTSRSDKGDVVKGIEAGADDFVSKPFDREELRVRLLAGERIILLEQALSQQNAQLREAGDRMRRDLDAAARVQRAMLPKVEIASAHVQTAWSYVPTEELAGDAVGLHLIEDRYLVAYVLDVSGHGVPAALLSVTAMHYLEPEPENASLLRDMSRSGGMGSVQKPSVVATEFNRRFSGDNSDNRFMTMILCVLDIVEGRLQVASAGHPLPVILRGRNVVPIADVAGLPIAVFESAQYDDVAVQLEPGDRVYMFTDGIVEQGNHDNSEQFGQQRFVDQLLADHDKDLSKAVTNGIDALAIWTGERRFSDDVSLVALEWIM